MAANDLKTRQILDAALAVFSRYGFRKTSMLDIAQAANMSRAALYLHFKNKEDVFRSLSAALHEEVLQTVEQAFDAQPGVMKKLEAALSAFALGLMAPIGASAHGQELFDANMALASDITADAKTTLQARVVQTLRLAEARGEIDLSLVGTTPAELAAMIHAALDGFKHAEPLGIELPARLTLFMRILAAALQVRPPQQTTAADH